MAHETGAHAQVLLSYLKYAFLKFQGVYLKKVLNLQKTHQLLVKIQLDLGLFHEFLLVTQ